MNTRAILKLTILIVGIIIERVIRYKRKNDYEKNMTDTMKFICAVTSLIYLTAGDNSCTKDDIGGMPNNDEGKEYAKKCLKEGWRTTDRESFFVMLNWLLTEGHNASALYQFNEYHNNPDFIIPSHSVLGCEKNEAQYEKYFKEFADKHSSIGIVAWDLVRVPVVAGWAYLAKYISYEECIEISVDACRKLQGIFGCWNQMVENYTEGYYYWSGNEVGMWGTQLFFNNSPEIFNVNWNTILDEKDVIRPRK